MPLKLTLSLSFLGTNEFHLSSLLHDEKKKKKEEEEEEEEEGERERERERIVDDNKVLLFQLPLFMCCNLFLYSIHMIAI